MLKGYNKDDLFVCKNCAEFTRAGHLKNTTCEHCSCELEYTGHEECSWFQEYYKHHTGANSKNTNSIMLYDWLRTYYLHDQYDHELHERIEEELEAEYLELEAEMNAIPHCPKCGCPSFRREKRGFGVGKAVATTALTGFLDVGLLAGATGKDKMVNCCNECGHKWG